MPKITAGIMVERGSFDSLTWIDWNACVLIGNRFLRFERIRWQQGCCLDMPLILGASFIVLGESNIEVGRESRNTGPITLEVLKGTSPGG